MTDNTKFTAATPFSKGVLRPTLPGEWDFDFEVHRQKIQAALNRPIQVKRRKVGTGYALSVPGRDGVLGLFRGSVLPADVNSEGWPIGPFLGLCASPTDTSEILGRFRTIHEANRFIFELLAWAQAVEEKS